MKTIQPEQNTETKEKENDMFNYRLKPEEIRKIIKKHIMALGPDVPKETKQKYAEIFVKVFEKKMSLRHALELSLSEVANIYRFAYSEFAVGKFASAREMFKVLRMLEPNSMDFALALGTCHHRLKDYEYAISCYMSAAIIDQENPIPFLYAYDCYIHLDKLFAAGMMISNVIERAGENPIYAPIKEKAELLLKGVAAEMKARREKEEEVMKK